MDFLTFSTWFGLIKKYFLNDDFDGDAVKCNKFSSFLRSLAHFAVAGSFVVH